MLGDPGVPELVRERGQVQVTLRGWSPARGGDLQPCDVTAATQNNKAPAVHWLHRIKGQSPC